MKKLLSELIIEGAKLRPQGYGIKFSKCEGKIYSTAMGAFYEATGHVEKTHGRFGSMGVTKILEDQVPAETRVFIDDWNNNRLKLTREQIAQRLIDEKLDVIIDY